MAAITAAKFYLGKTAQASGNWYCNIRSAGLITTDVGTGTILGTSDAVNYTAIPDNATPGWTTFTFSTPVTISSSGWYGVQIYNDTSDYASANVYAYYASDFNDPDEERGWINDRLGGDAGWDSGGYDFAYDITITDAGDVGALTPTGTSQRSGGSGSDKGLGVRTYLTVDSPSKATNPTPADEATEVDWSTPTLDWDGTGDTYTVYIATATPFVASDKVAEDIAVTTYTLSTEQKNDFADSDSILYWRVDSTKDGSTLTGDTWSFDPRPGQATGPTPATAGTDIGLSDDLEWTAGTNATEVTVEMTHPDTLEITELVSGELVSSYSWSSDYLTWDKTFSWAVDSTNFYGTTSGAVWTFTTLDFDHLRTTYNTIDGGDGPYDGGVEGVDFWWTGLNNVCTVKRLVLLSKDRFYFEELS